MTDDKPEESFGAEVVQEMLYSHLADALSQYRDSINRLWAGCGGGLIGVVTILRHPKDPLFWLSAGSFGLGILVLGVGAFWTLIVVRAVIRHLEDINGIMQMRLNYMRRLSDEAGLSLSHPQTWTAIAAAGLFVVGVVCAIALVCRY